MDNNEEKKVKEKYKYDKNEEWYDISKICLLYDLSHTICKKRLRINKSQLIEGKTIKSYKSRRGKRTQLYHFSILNNIFGLRKKPNHFNIKNVRMNYIGTSKWDYIGFITPKRSSLIDLNYKMKYMYNQLILKYGKKSGIKLFYSFEPNPNDNYFHCHFLIYSKKKIEELSHLVYLLKIIGGDKTKDETPYIIWQYDYLNFGYTGSFYSFKEKSVFDELL
jgi:hypothetical protein